MGVFNLHGDKWNRTEERPAALEGCVDRCEANNAHCAGWRFLAIAFAALALADAPALFWRHVREALAERDT